MGFRRLWKPSTNSETLVLTVPKDIVQMLEGKVLYVDWFTLISKHKEAITSQTLPEVNKTRETELSPNEEFDFRAL